MLAKKYHHDFANLSGCVEDTLVDPDVRDAWRVMPNRIHIENPRWHSALQRVVEAACEKLGAADDTEATLHNSLIYKAGDHLLCHRDGEKDPRFFGTLVILLPSRHQGGELVVSHAGNTVTLSAGDACLCEVQLEHEHLQKHLKKHKKSDMVPILMPKMEYCCFTAFWFPF